MTQTAPLTEHQQFLNRYYGASRHIYDLTRKYYLLGRDPTLQSLLKEDWRTLVEIGPGTGRNLVKLHQKRPQASYFGIEASDAMLEVAQRKCPFARIVPGLAEQVDIATAIGARPDRILFSYCLSMVEDPRRALENAQRALAPGGHVVVVDFGEGEGLPGWFRGTLESWLNAFRVHPIAHRRYRDWGATSHSAWGGYVIFARLAAPA
ncbi:MAG TPA: class I SAM-dependent methyltransferase [Polyangiaceae bacterium]|nr:class I SAM-dependent methyltransferase [Polyangiaceae bacterium]